MTASDAGAEAGGLEPRSCAPLHRLGERWFRAIIPSGELVLRLKREDIPLGEALDFAARNNANRRFLFVSRLLGRHLPTRPARLRMAAEALAEKLHAAGVVGPCLFIGMAETATTLAQAVFRAWTALGGRGLYLDTTRRRTGGEVALSFTEDHSHAPGHAVHRPTAAEDPERVFERAETLVIVDDEMTTGRTAVNLVRAYEALRGRRVAAHLAVLVRWGAGDFSAKDGGGGNRRDWEGDGEGRRGKKVGKDRSSALEDPAVEKRRRREATGLVANGVQAHALIEGEFEFVQNATFTPKPLAEVGDYHSVRAPRGARHGVAHAQELREPEVEVRAGERVLVVGVGEFGFAPLLLAEAIEAQGGEAYVQATTRSPVALGGAIGHARAFPALTGEGYTEFLYNVPEDHPYGRVIVCCEDELPPAGHPIFGVPRVEVRRVEI